MVPFCAVVFSVTVGTDTVTSGTDWLGSDGFVGSVGLLGSVGLEGPEGEVGFAGAVGLPSVGFVVGTVGLFALDLQPHRESNRHRIRIIQILFLTQDPP